MPATDHNLIAPEQGSSRQSFDVIAFELDQFAHMPDVICNDGRKYSPDARKFEAKAKK
jgi:hypothetical protein